MLNHAAQSTAKALFVVADEPLLVFRSVEAAAVWLEVIDVADGVYGPACGAKGEPYLITHEGNRVVIEPTAEPPRADELRKLLFVHLERRGSPVDLGSPLAALVAMTCTLGFDL